MVPIVYNYMVTNYSPKSMTRYDSHKPGELRSLYRSIVAKSCRSPLYKIKLSDNIQNRLIQMKDSALSLSDSLSLLNPEDSCCVFHHKQADSGNPASASVCFADDVDDTEELSPVIFKVNQLATCQRNTSRAVSNSDSTPPRGAYSFSISINGRTKTFPMEISSSEKNSDILSRISSSINAARIGVHSFIESNNSYMTLSLESDHTGHGSQELNFYLSDVLKPEFQKGLLSYYSLLSPTQYPQNALYETDGTEHESTTNEIQVDAYQVSLHQVSSEAFSIGTKTDSEKLLEGLEQLRNSYNNLVSLSESSMNRGFNKKLSNNLNAVQRRFHNELESCGILFEKDGRMTLDESLAIQSAQTDDLKQLFSSTSDLTHSLRQMIASISLDPMDYARKILITYPNLKKPPVANPYMTSIYSGMLFNYYC